MQKLLQGGDGEEGKERPSLRTRLELPIQVRASCGYFESYHSL